MASDTRPGGAQRPNTLGLARSELGPLLDQLDFTWSGFERESRRGFVRWPFRRETIELRLRHPGGSASTLRVACRNLSRAGMSVLHSAFIHPGTACAVTIPHAALGGLAVAGRVARCAHRSGLVHEIGVRFDDELDVRQFIAHDPFSDFFALERVEPARLAGRVVCIDSADIGHRIVRHFLRDSDVRLSPAFSAREGMAMAEDGCDLVLCDLNLRDATGIEVAAALRARGVRTPIIVLTTEKSAALKRASAGAGVDAFLLKPPDHEMLLRAVGEFLIVRRDACADAPAQTPTPGRDPLMALHLESLAAGAGELEAAVRSGDARSARLACLRIAGSSGAGTFSAVRLLALDAARSLASAERLHDAVGPLRRLVRACREAPRRTPA